MRFFLRTRFARLRRSERGAILIEAQIGIVILFLIAGGIVEYASVFGSAIDLSSAVRSGARTGSITLASGPNDDYSTAQAVIQRAGSKRSNIQKIVIYKAAPNSSGPPAACRTSSVSVPAQSCNVYVQSDLSLGQAAFDAKGNGWPSASRTPAVDFIGVYVEAKRNTLFKGFGSPTVVSDNDAMLIALPIVPSKGANWVPLGTKGDPGWEDPEWGCWGAGRGCFASTSTGSTGSGGGKGGSG